MTNGYQRSSTPYSDRLTGTIVLPQEISHLIDRHAATAATREPPRNAIRDKLTSWLHEHGPAPYRDGHISADDVRRWQSPALFAAPTIAWRTNPAPGIIAAALEAWRAADHQLWDAQEHGRRRALGHRDDLYRQIAAAFTAQAAHVVIDDINIARIAALHAPETTGRPTSNMRSTVGAPNAAPGVLRSAIVAAAGRHGVRLTVAPAKGLSRIHADCGHGKPRHRRAAAGDLPKMRQVL